MGDELNTTTEGAVVMTLKIIIGSVLSIIGTLSSILGILFLIASKRRSVTPDFRRGPACCWNCYADLRNHKLQERHPASVRRELGRHSSSLLR